MPGHAKAARIVDDDQISAAALNELGADSGAGARGDDRLAFLEGSAQALDYFCACVWITFSGPAIGHKCSSKFARGTLGRSCRKIKPNKLGTCAASG